MSKIGYVITILFQSCYLSKWFSLLFVKVNFFFILISYVNKILKDKDSLHLE